MTSEESGSENDTQIKELSSLLSSHSQPKRAKLAQFNTYFLQFGHYHHILDVVIIVISDIIIFFFVVGIIIIMCIAVTFTSITVSRRSQGRITINKQANK